MDTWDQPELSRPTAAARLGPDRLLWEVPCGRGAYNMASLWFVVDGDRARPAVTGAGSPEAPAHLLTNGGYDPDTRILGEFNKGRGLADCGVEASWLWDGQRFALLERREMRLCEGLSSDEWPLTYQARRR